MCSGKQIGWDALFELSVLVLLPRRDHNKLVTKGGTSNPSLAVLPDSVRALAPGTSTSLHSCSCSHTLITMTSLSRQHNNEDTCSGQGTAQPDGTCRCFSASLGLGADCSSAISNAASCSGAGTAQLVFDSPSYDHGPTASMQTPTVCDECAGCCVGATTLGDSIRYEVCAPCTMTVTGTRLNDKAMVGPNHYFNGRTSNLYAAPLSLSQTKTSLFCVQPQRE